jgi:hypothetical protein
LQQELSADQKQGKYQGAYIYLGPSLGSRLPTIPAEGGIKALETDIDEFVLASQTDGM